jgi:hypothetical protein
MEYKQEDHVSVKKEEEDVKIKLEDIDEDDLDVNHEDADGELLMVMKVDTECNHLQPRILGSTLWPSHVHGTPNCGECGIFIPVGTFGGANRCRICDGYFCLSHKFSLKKPRNGQPSNSRKMANRKRLPEFIRKLGIDKYIERCDPREHRGKDVEAFMMWAYVVFYKMITEDRKFVPEAVHNRVRTKWESQHFQNLAVGSDDGHADDGGAQ